MQGTEFPVTFKRLPLTLQAMRWNGLNEGAIQAELAGKDFQAVVPCPGECPCKAKVNPEITGEVLNSFGDWWQGVETGWWICRSEHGQLFTINPEVLEANYVQAGPDGPAE